MLETFNNGGHFWDGTAHDVRCLILAAVSVLVDLRTVLFDTALETSINSGHFWDRDSSLWEDFQLQVLSLIS